MDNDHIPLKNPDHDHGDYSVNSPMSERIDLIGPEEMSAMSRKQFMALLAASAAFATAGCSEYRNKGDIVPHIKKPEEITPGIPNYYASTCTGCSQVCGILIKTREGRPIKVDGNPEHPINKGKICSKGLASILNLYDPYRLQSPKYGDSARAHQELTWNIVDAEVGRQLEAASNNKKEIALVTRSIHSPTFRSVLDTFKKKYPTTALYSYSLFNDETRRRAWRKCYGTYDIPVIQWNKAKVIVALESDFLATDGMVMEQVREFAHTRDVVRNETKNRFYCVEGALSLTGSNADYRISLRPDVQYDFIQTLIRACDKTQYGVDKSVKEFAENHHISLDVLEHLIADLRRHAGESIVLAGAILPEHVHIAVNYLNELLGNSKLYDFNQVSTTIVPLSASSEWENIINKMNNEKIGVIIHIDANPVYHLPHQYKYGSALKSVPLSISMTEAEDETSILCSMVLPIHHAFESWGDYQVRSGILSLQQPVIEPLYHSRQKESILLHWINSGLKYSEKDYHEFLRHRWNREVYTPLRLKVDFESFWHAALQEGFVKFTESPSKNVKFHKPAIATVQAPQNSDLTLAITESYFLGDGSFANNGWLQEVPHPISKIVWDNYAALSPKTARDLNLATGDIVHIKHEDGSADVPIFIQSGHADGHISLAAGYGRTNAGPVGNNVGSDVHGLLSVQSLCDTKVFSDIKLIKTENKYELVSTQKHLSLNDEFVKDIHLKRKIIREGTLSEFQKDPNFLHYEEEKLFNITKEIQYDGVKWAMAVDLNKCIGCSACVAGCNVENNIPVVGKEQTSKGREMHWIRVDRYYAGTDDEPAISYQPMMCQHCDNAPCENVCPVAATNHSPDGLNQMVYNRCVGTKYCSNNCPYKVRRFNYFAWWNDFKDGYYEQPVVDLVHNPEVTVRSRGVMEKCTFCIQLIMEARQHAIEEGRSLKGSDVKTACQQACPATAIVFGDVNEANSEIARARSLSLGYGVLEELNVRPNVTYIAKLKNTYET